MEEGILWTCLAPRMTNTFCFFHPARLSRWLLSYLKWLTSCDKTGMMAETENKMSQTQHKLGQWVWRRERVLPPTGQSLYWRWLLRSVAEPYWDASFGHAKADSSLAAQLVSSAFIHACISAHQSLAPKLLLLHDIRWELYVVELKMSKSIWRQIYWHVSRLKYLVWSCLEC